MTHRLFGKTVFLLGYVLELNALILTSKNPISKGQLLEKSEHAGFVLYPLRFWDKSDQSDFDILNVSWWLEL